ncbi:MAG: hypothetical protein DWI02_04590 [Planctomycetota bacterium]|nr:MAG: hypothetical protein DWI02_04590 [Planctomycetota bacterium]
MGIHLEDGWRPRFFRGIAVFLRGAAIFLSVPDWLFPDSIHPEDQASFPVQFFQTQSPSPEAMK